MPGMPISSNVGNAWASSIIHWIPDKERFFAGERHIPARNKFLKLVVEKASYFANYSPIKLLYFGILFPFIILPVPAQR
jgi:hypothetical protein